MRRTFARRVLVVRQQWVQVAPHTTLACAAAVLWGSTLTALSNVKTALLARFLQILQIKEASALCVQLVTTLRPEAPSPMTV